MIKYYIDSNLQQYDETYLQQCFSWFPPEETAFIETIHHLQGRIERTSAYALLAQALKEFGIEELPALRHTETGKPYLEGHPEIEISISHCRKSAAVALSTQGPVGIDIEYRRNISPALIKRVCNSEEQQAIATDPDPTLAFLRLWTLKEAYAKYIGTGLTDDLQNFLPNAKRADLLLESHPLPDGWISLCYQPTEEPSSIN